MIRLLNGAALAAGLAAALWVAVTHAGSHPAVLPMLALIVAAFLTGVAELRRYRTDTHALLVALNDAQAQPPAAIEHWLASLPEALRGAARLRLQGDRAALPGPLMAPYLTGLLVLLGLLGTFIGMVATLGGTVSALGASADLQAVRSALASPVQGLGLAFGTSVAGVAASASLGLMSALARGERTQASRALDAALATVLHAHTEDHRRALMLQALQASVAQAQVLPAVAQGLETALLQVAAEQRAGIQALVQEQARFHERAGADAARLGVELREGLNQASVSMAEGLSTAAARIEQGLMGIATRAEQGLQGTATRVERALLQSAVEGAQQSRALLEPMVQTGLQQLLQQVAAHQEAMAEQARQTQRALAGAAEQGQAALQEAVQATQAALSAQAEATRSAFVRHTAEGFDTFLTRFEQHTAQWLAQAAQEQAQLHRGLTTAATEAMAALRQQTSDSLARDREQLAERERLLGAVDTLMQALQHAATEQRQALDGLLATAAQKLDHSAERFDTQAAQVAASLAAATEQAGSSAHTLATVGEGFAQAVQGFSQANLALGQQLAAVECALGQHLARSDEQLAYYVAQAREVIELTLGAQQQLLEDLRRVSRGDGVQGVQSMQPMQSVPDLQTAV